MALPLLLLLLAGHPGAPLHSTRRTETLAAVEVSAAQRFGWVYTVLRREAVAAQPLPRAPAPAHGGRAAPLVPASRAEDLVALPRSKDGREVARAARWIDALPVKVDAQDGGFVFALRLRGP